MTLFGRSLDGIEITSLVSLLMAPALWITVWRRDRRAPQWFKSWNDGRKARRDAGIAAENGEAASPSTGRGQPLGPWG